MKSIETYQTMLKEHKYPCFIVDKDSDNVLYANKKMEKLVFPTAQIVGTPYIAHHRFLQQAMHSLE